MLTIGCHLTSSKGFFHMGKTALSIGANTFQFFTRNPRGAKAKAVDPKDAKKLVDFMDLHKFPTILAHAPYTLNPCSATEHLRHLAVELIADDLQRMEYVPGNMYNFHPGSHGGQGIEAGVNFVAEALNKTLFEGQRTQVLLETMAGKGSEVGSKFEELRDIFDRVTLRDKLGVCLDTCHVSDAGYDITNDLDGVLTHFDTVIGLKNLKAIHLNDSLNPLGSHKDRHAKIGEGFLGLDAIIRIINHPALCHLPFYLETPNELDGYAAEIALLRESFHPK